MKCAKIVICILIFIFSSILNFQCQKQKEKVDNDIEITFWHSFVSSTIPALNNLIAKFESENPNIRIKAQYIPSGDALIQKLISAVQSETAPDISWIHADYLSELVQANAIYKMRHFIDSENGLTEEDINDIYPPLLHYASWRDTLYSMPLEATNLALLYNKDMLYEVGLDSSRPPQTWDELHAYAKRLTVDRDNDGKFDQVGFFVPIYPASGPLGAWMVWQWIPFLWQAGGYVIDQNQSQVLYNSSSGIQALTFWQALFNMVDISTFTVDYQVAFAAKRLAMALDGPWNLPRYNKLLRNLDWAIAPLPEGPEKRVTIVAGEYLAIFKQSRYPQEAWQFIKWVIQPENQAFWSIRSGYLPMRRSVLNIPEFKDYMKSNKNFAVFVKQMEYGQSQRSIDYHGIAITRHIADAIEKATIGKMDSREALDEAANKSNTLLNSVQEDLKK